MRRGLTSLPVLVCLLAACGGRTIDLEPGGEENEAGSEGGKLKDGGEHVPDGRASRDAGRDGVSDDALGDGNPESGVESGTDGAGDASADGPRDAGSDGPAKDSSADGPAKDSSADAPGKDADECGTLIECDGTCVDAQTDPNNCGYCGHSCGGEACTGGVCTPVTIVSMQDNAYWVAADDTNVYWTVQGTGTNGAVVQAPVGGGTSLTLASSQAYPEELAVNATTVFWTTAEGDVYSVPIGGGATTTIASGQNEPLGVVVDSAHVYWTNNDYGSMKGGSVASAPLGGGKVTTLASNQYQPGAIAVAGGTLFFCDEVNLMSVPTSGGSSKSFQTNDYPYAVAADATNIYWTDSNNDGDVLEAPLSGGATVTLAINQNYPNSIAVDAKNVYFTTGEGGAGTVMEVPIGTSTPVALATGEAYPVSVAVNGTRVFWVDFGDGTLKSVPK